MNSRNSANLPAEYEGDAANRVVPSWLISLVLHGLLLGSLILASDRKGTPEGSGEEFRDVGLFTKDELAAAVGAGSDSGHAEAEATNAAASADASAIPLISDERADSGPAVPLELPQTATIGSGPPLPTSLPARATKPASNGGRGRVRGTGTGPGGGGGGGALGARFGRSDGTSFFQVAAQGERFYYVVDCSGSMDDANKIGVARAELMASIERLDPDRQFQLLFYDSDLHPLLNGKQDVFFATDINRTLARQFINSRQPDSGTLHRPALMAALRSAPDVIFFLTDGDEPDLSFRDLKELRQANRGNTQIHVIQFGEGAKLGPMNWLEKLAQDNQGTYRYRDVKAFR